MHISDTHGVENVAQRLWTSAEHTSSGQYVWPSGDVVSFGMLAGRINGRAHLIMYSAFNLRDKTGSERAGFFCEACTYINI